MSTTIFGRVPDVFTRTTVTWPSARHESILTKFGAMDCDKSWFAPLGHQRRGAGVGGGGGVVGVGSRHCDVWCVCGFAGEYLLAGDEELV